MIDSLHFHWQPFVERTAIRRVAIVRCQTNVVVALVGPDRRAKNAKFYPVVSMVRAPNHWNANAIPDGRAFCVTFVSQCYRRSIDCHESPVLNSATFLLQQFVPKTAVSRMDTVRNRANADAKLVGKERTVTSATLTQAARTATVDDRGNAIASEFQFPFACLSETDLLCLSPFTEPASAECCATKVTFAENDHSHGT